MGRFSPGYASQQPDFAYVTQDADHNGPSGGDGFLKRSMIPWSYDDANAKVLENAGYYPTDYYYELWRPASRISTDLLTQSDLDRAGYFLAGAWRKGTGGACPPEDYDVTYGRLNSSLENEAEGLDIGSKIGIALASLFSFGAASASSDASFGFGRGASEDRSAKVDTANLQSSSLDIGFDNAFAPPKVSPSGAQIATERVRIQQGFTLGCYPNLFYPLYKRYDQGYASKSVDERARVKGIDGYEYIKIGYAYPWNSQEMGCALSYKERVYIAARMLRTLDVIGATTFPRPVEVDMYDPTQGTLGQFIAPNPIAAQYRYDVMTARFGALRGSIFPPMGGDRPVLAPGRIAQIASNLTNTGVTAPAPMASVPEQATSVAGTSSPNAGAPATSPVLNIGHRLTSLV